MKLEGFSFLSGSNLIQTNISWYSDGVLLWMLKSFIEDTVELSIYTNSLTVHFRAKDTGD